MLPVFILVKIWADILALSALLSFLQWKINEQQMIKNQAVNMKSRLVQLC